LVIPGPEQPLVDGIEAVFRRGVNYVELFIFTFLIILPVGIPVFGPTAEAARMEGSKAFSKEFMARHSIPTASFKVFTKDQYEEACTYVRNCSHRVVLKASGLAAGKGVLIPEVTAEALEALKQILVDQVFGNAGELNNRNSVSYTDHPKKVMRLWSKSIWRVPNFPSSLSQMATRSSHYLLPRTTSELGREILV